MKQTQIKRWYYHFRHRFLTTNNLVMIVALFIAAGWAWGSVEVLQRNYALQSEINTKERQLTLIKLETQTLGFQQRYYKSDEYKELALRERLGLGFVGEKLLILPPNTTESKQPKQSVVRSLPKPTKSGNIAAMGEFLIRRRNGVVKTRCIC